LDKLCGNSQKENKIELEVYRLFKAGNRYTNKDIKNELKNLYERLGYQKTAKATDIEDWFVTKPIKMQDSTSKWTHGLELLNKK
jgi:hypothetical protein